MIKKAIIIVSICVLFLFIVSSFKVSAPTNNTEVVPTPNSIITILPENSQHFKLAKNTYYQFSYPANWHLYANQETDFIAVSEDAQNRTANDFSVTSLYLEECSPSRCLSVEEQIVNQEKYWLSSTSQLGDMDPVRLSEKEIVVDGEKGKQYVYKLMKPYEGVSDIVTWYFVPFKDKIFWIKAMGDDADELHTIFLSLKFVL